jgi:hypothetical protein
MGKRRPRRIYDGEDGREDRDVGYFSSSFTSVDWHTVAVFAGIAAVAFVGIRFVINIAALTKQAQGNVAQNQNPDVKRGPDPNPIKPGPVIVPPKHDPVIVPKHDPEDDRGYDPNFLKIAALQAWFGHDMELAATCDRTLKFLKDTNNPALAEHAAKICSIRPLDDKTHEAALVLARRAVELGRQNAFLANFQMALGMAEYRSGNYATADAELLVASQLGKGDYYVSTTTAFYQAMSLFRQGEEAEANKLAAGAIRKMKPLPADEKNPLVGRANADDLILWMAYKETKELLK